MGTDQSIDKQIVFFDGVCNLCNSSVQFIIKNDKKQKFLFASLQSDFADENLSPEYTKSLHSIVLKKGSQVKTKSSAVLRIARGLPGLWPLVSIFLLVPKFIRDFFYDLVAKNRYRWFGKKDHCMLPSPDLISRFVG